MERLLKAIHEGEISWEDLDNAVLNVEKTELVDNKHTTDLIVTLKNGNKYGWRLIQYIEGD